MPGSCSGRFPGDGRVAGDPGSGITAGRPSGFAGRFCRKSRDAPPPRSVPGKVPGVAGFRKSFSRSGVGRVIDGLPGEGRVDGNPVLGRLMVGRLIVGDDGRVLPGRPVDGRVGNVCPGRVEGLETDGRVPGFTVGIDGRVGDGRVTGRDGDGEGRVTGRDGDGRVTGRAGDGLLIDGRETDGRLIDGERLKPPPPPRPPADRPRWPKTSLAGKATSITARTTDCVNLINEDMMN